MKKSTKKTQSLSDALKEDIRSGLYSAGCKLPSERELAERKEVSRTTTRTVLQALETEGILECRNTVGYYVSSKAVDILAENDQKACALKVAFVCMPKRFRSPFYLNFFEELTRLCEPRILTTSYFHSLLKPNVYKRDKMDVVIVGDPYDDDDLKAIQKIGIKTIVFKRESSISDFICTDNHLGGYMMMEYLAKNGHKEIFSLNAPADFTDNEFSRRFKGMEVAAQKLGVTIHSKNLGIFSDVFRLNRFASFLTEPNRKTTAIVTFFDLASINVIELLDEHDLRTPEDISVIGFDDNFFSSRLPVPLTTVRHDYKQIAAKLTGWLKAFIDDPDLIIKEKVEPLLVNRKSVKNLRINQH